MTSLNNIDEFIVRYVDARNYKHGFVDRRKRQQRKMDVDRHLRIKPN